MGTAPPGAAAASQASTSEAAVTSTDTASTTIGRSRMRKEKLRRYACSKSLIIAAAGPSGTTRAVSVPSYLRWARRTPRI